MRILRKRDRAEFADPQSASPQCSTNPNYWTYFAASAVDSRSPECGLLAGRARWRRQSAPQDPTLPSSRLAELTWLVKLTQKGRWSLA